MSRVSHMHWWQFNGLYVQLFSDLSMLTLQTCRVLQPFLSVLKQSNFLTLLSPNRLRLVPALQLLKL